MARLLLVRHGEAAGGWDTDHDPGLSRRGHAQAAATADRLAPWLATGGDTPPVLSSPLRRTRETAAAIERRWQVEAVVDPEVGEIPSPTDDLTERSAWLRDVLAGRWSSLGSGEQSWRAAVLARLAAIGRGPAAASGAAVVVTHFVAINVAVGAATGDDRVMVFGPAHASITEIDVDPAGGLTLVALGAEAATPVR